MIGFVQMYLKTYQIIIYIYFIHVEPEWEKVIQISYMMEQNV